MTVKNETVVKEAMGKKSIGKAAMQTKTKEAIAATVIIPNLNGMQYLENCLQSLYRCEEEAFPVIIVDNGSTDESVAFIKRNYPQVQLICFSENRGFCSAVNAGIIAARTPYVILLNNDTAVERHFVSRLTEAVSRKPCYFSAGAKMVSMKDKDMIDDAGDYYCAFGWAFARGKGKNAADYNRPCNIFAACGGAAVYRRDVLLELGLFDEAHFAYLEDIDIGWRARIRGYVNRFEPGAVVRHAGSGFSGSRYNEFKIRLSSRNSVYLIGKNMPPVQILLNLPFLLCGFFIKYIFFAKKGYGKVYRDGLKKGWRMCGSEAGKARKVRFSWKNFPRYVRLEGELLYNLFVRRLFC